MGHRQADWFHLGGDIATRVEAGTKGAFPSKTPWMRLIGNLLLRN